MFIWTDSELVDREVHSTPRSPQFARSQVKQPITGYHIDDEGHWVAQLACGHNQHVRHDPPWIVREWVTTPSGRDEMLGHRLVCKKCESGEPPDDRPAG